MQYSHKERCFSAVNSSPPTESNTRHGARHVAAAEADLTWRCVHCSRAGCDPPGECQQLLIFAPRWAMWLPILYLHYTV